LPQAEAVIAHQEESENQRGIWTRVLIVDDEPLLAFTMPLILRMNGFDSSFFISPIEALETTRSDATDLLISDVTMPVFTGIELGILIKHACPACKTSLISGQPQTAVYSGRSEMTVTSSSCCRSHSSPRPSLHESEN
jgi:CheY-like chemotaxis protein